MRDFTLSVYRTLVEALRQGKYDVMGVAAFLMRGGGPERVAILRHDLDRSPADALAVAHLERELGVATTYYFRTTRSVLRPAILREIEALGHEVGYHYEDLAACDGDLAKAWERFQANVARFRSLGTLRTICMHGSPLSTFNNLDLWKIFSYKSLGLIGEPYLDFDYSRVTYLTDTGRRWDGMSVSFRDRVPQASVNFPCRSSFDLIAALRGGGFPRLVHMATHPERWHEDRLGWAGALAGQGIRNMAKRALRVWRKW
jgi:hypothetical protein